MRILLQYVLPFLLPTLCYLLWVWYATRRANATGGTAPALAEGPWVWLIGAGAALVIAMLAAIALTTGADRDAGSYRAPVFKDGEIVPPGYD
jgi:hypothetical protein